MMGQQFEPGAVATTSTVIEYHGNYKELPSNQDNLSAAVLAQVSANNKQTIPLFIVAKTEHVGANLKRKIEYWVVAVCFIPSELG